MLLQRMYDQKCERHRGEKGASDIANNARDTYVEADAVPNRELHSRSHGACNQKDGSKM